ncbi:Gfo/Idh/MocA family oxidoreductase [bacterium]|nr:Gfo/Idh/MocA family oxidoreductase [bacterium]
MNKHNIGVIGCGDFLRWQADAIRTSKSINVKSLFDTDPARAEKYAGRIGGAVVTSADAIFADKAIDVVCLFVPPWVRRGLVEKATQAGKHIIATKPLGPAVEDCAAMVSAVERAKIKCGIIYRRTDHAASETYRKIFDSGEIGRLALYKHDWIHHYPEWNQWATDPEKNGGPFMDAMIHNMNMARYLMGRPATFCTYFSDNHAHPGLKCNDTEFMKLDFDGNGSAHLFITWAADLAVYSKDGNDREHIDLFYMVTDQGWRLTDAWKDGKMIITASKDGTARQWTVEPPAKTSFDAFAECIDSNGPLPPNIPGVREAFADIKLIKDADQNRGVRFAVKMT